MEVAYLKIEILGMGCAKCKALEGNVRKAVAETGLQAEITRALANGGAK